MDHFQDTLLLRALNCQPVERTPVWLMRQAGRYLPEYRKVRQQVKDFWELCQTPELACEVTLQPLRRYDLDASIVFSDILTIPQALGLDIAFKESKGPVFNHIIHDKQSIEDLRVEGVMERLEYVFQTVKLCRQSLPQHVPLFGFSGSPWTLACYMLEGQSSRDFDKVFKFLFQSPENMRLLLDKLTTVICDYLIEQVAHGVQALMLFDTWGGILPALQFVEFDWVYLQKITNTLKKRCPETPLVIFSKGTGCHLTQLAQLTCHGLSLDWTVNLGLARKIVGPQMALQGNLHPKILLQSPDVIVREITGLLDAYGQKTGHIFNLGHGITPDVPPDAVHVLIDTVRQVSSKNNL